MIIRNLINKFLERNEKSIDSANNILAMNGVVLVGSSDADFDFKNTVIKEVTQYCKEQGIDHIDKVVIMSVYDADIFSPTRKLVFDQQQTSKSESKIVVVSEDDKLIAQVYFSEYLEIRGDN
jgi:hypothetical protein